MRGFRESLSLHLLCLKCLPLKQATCHSPTLWAGVSWTPVCTFWGDNVLGDRSPPLLWELHAPLAPEKGLAGQIPEAPMLVCCRVMEGLVSRNRGPQSLLLCCVVLIALS